MKLFAMAPTPGLLFGEGSFQRLPDLLPVGSGQTILLIRSGSFGDKPEYNMLLSKLRGKGALLQESVVRNEPTPELVNAITSFQRRNHIAMVLGIGGGSVLDTAKAVAAMLTVEAPVEQFLEGVGSKQHPGTRLPLVLCPTTAGTGSEATKNAVLSKKGPNGYKLSLRHEQFVPDLAVVDPTLMIGLPLPVAAASGMDAFTQLLEAYLSIKSNPMTDALCAPAIGLCLSALERLSEVWTAEERFSERLELMSLLAYSATISGIALANAGLGTVHGFASSVGGATSAPHGVICGTLLAPVLQRMLPVLEADKDALAWRKLQSLANATNRSVRDWVEHIRHVSEQLGLTSLSLYGLTLDMCADLAKVTANKESPVALPVHELESILRTVCSH